MSTIKIQIEKTTLKGDLGLFALPVKPGAKVHFRCNDPGFEVEFSNSSPFVGPATRFPIPSNRTVASSPVCGIYSFLILRKGETEPMTYHQLAVGNDGIEELGFSIIPAQPGEVEVHIELHASRGQLEIILEKSVVNEEATVMIKGSTYHLGAGATTMTVPEELGEKLHVTLEPTLESGGTKVVDIIPEG